MPNQMFLSAPARSETSLLMLNGNKNFIINIQDKSELCNGYS